MKALICALAIMFVSIFILTRIWGTPSDPNHPVTQIGAFVIVVGIFFGSFWLAGKIFKK